MMSALPIQEDLTPVTPRRGPRTAMAKENGKGKPIFIPPISKNRKQPPPRHSLKVSKTVVKTPEDDRRLRNGRTTYFFMRFIIPL
jgi:hypothetical protein